jgi:hypothetical protein
VENRRLIVIQATLQNEKSAKRLREDLMICEKEQVRTATTPGLVVAG